MDPSESTADTLTPRKKIKATRPPWFAIRRDLPPQRRAVLMTLSFFFPLALYLCLAYIPYFHENQRVVISADRGSDLVATYVVGEPVPKDFFSTFQGEIRTLNERITSGAYLEDNPPKVNPILGTVETISYTRPNLLKLRFLTPILVINGWNGDISTDDFEQLDPLLYQTLGELAEGKKESTKVKISPENMEIIKKNWETLKAESPTFSNAALSKEPLLNLIPQGVSSPSRFTPTIGRMYEAIYGEFTRPSELNNPNLGWRVVQSMSIVFGGFLLAAAIGLPIGLLCGGYDFFAKLIEPFTDFFRYMPAPTFSVLLIALLGTQNMPKIALVFLGTFPHLILMLGNTTRQLDASLLEAAQTLGAKRGSLIFKVIVPGILPQIYADLRVLLGWAWTWLVIAELIGVKSGLTEIIEVRGNRYQYQYVYPVIIMIGMIGFFTDQFLQWLANLIFPWEATNRKPNLIVMTIKRLLSSSKSPRTEVEGNTHE